MLFDFPYLQAGFSDEQWDHVPRTDKVIIRDWYLMKGDLDAVMYFGFYQTDRHIRGAVKDYGLRARPQLQLSLA